MTNLGVTVLVVFLGAIYLRDASTTLHDQRTRRAAAANRTPPQQKTAPDDVDDFADEAALPAGRQAELSFDDFGMDDEDVDDFAADDESETVALEDDDEDLEHLEHDADSEFDDPDFADSPPAARRLSASARAAKRQRGERGAAKRGKRRASGGVHQMLVEFCTSWSYKGNFVRLKEFLENQYPELQGNIQGANFPAPALYQLIATVAGFTQMFGMAFVFFGDKIFGWIGVPEPAFMAQIKENKMMTFGAIYMFNIVAQNLVSTGAFEVSYNGERIFSKLETGRMPDANMIVAQLEAHGLSQ